MTKAMLPPPNTWLSIDDCAVAYTTLAKLINGKSFPPFAQRYPGKLEAILGSVSQEFGGELLYQTLGSAAAAYFVMMIKDHPFQDANKRSAVLFTDLFISINGWSLTFEVEEMYSLAVLVAEENELTFDEIKEGVEFILSQHLVKVERQPFYKSLAERGQSLYQSLLVRDRAVKS